MANYKSNAQIYDSQFVIRDSGTTTSATSGGLVVEGGISSKDTFVSGDVAINNVRITPNLGDIVKEDQAQLAVETEDWMPITNDDDVVVRFDNSYTTSVKMTVWVKTTPDDPALPRQSVWEINAVLDASVWIYNTSFTGDLIDGLDFRVTAVTEGEKSFGVVQYQNTSLNTADIRFRATTSAPYDVFPELTTNLVTDLTRDFLPDSLIYANSTQTFTYSEGLAYRDDTLNAANVSTGSIVVGGGGMTVGGDLIPSANIQYDLGSADMRWRDLYLSGTTINLGGAEISAQEGGSISLGDAGIEIVNVNASGMSHTLGSVFIDGGLVSAGGLMATSVSAGTLVANVMSAGTLVANSVTGGSISVSTITGTTVSAGTLVATTMTCGSIGVSTIIGSVVSAGTLVANSLTGGSIAVTSVSAGNIQLSGQLNMGTQSISSTTGGLVLSDHISAKNIHPFKNRIINGDMVVNQRGLASVNVKSLGNQKIFVDRWMLLYDTTTANTGNFTASQQAITNLPGFSRALRILNTTGTNTPAWQGVAQAVEGYHIADCNWGTSVGSPMTLSFWVRSSVTRTLGIIIGQKIGPDAAQQYGALYTINAANTWEYKTVTIPAPAEGTTWATDNNNGLSILFTFVDNGNASNPSVGWQNPINSNLWGVKGQSNFTSNNNATWDITGVQLEKGSLATPYEFRSYASELTLCKRYFQRLPQQIGGNVNPAGGGFSILRLPFPHEMRVAPSVTNNPIMIGISGVAPVYSVTITGSTSLGLLQNIGNTFTNVVQGAAFTTEIAIDVSAEHFSTN